ncbi:MAG: carboxymuconolactone decarboxylase family protein [Acidimicrobiia bacterium]
MASVRLVEAEPAPLLARPYYRQGDPGPIVAALANVPELLEVCAPFLGVLFGRSAVPARAKELVVLRTSARMGCRFCVDAHSVVALDTGLSHAEVRALRTSGGPELAATFADPAERALLAWVDALARPGAPPAPVRRHLGAQFADHEVVELTLLAGAAMMLNRFATGLELPTPAETRDPLDAAGLTVGPP